MDIKKYTREEKVLALQIYLSRRGRTPIERCFKEAIVVNAFLGSDEPEKVKTWEDRLAEAHERLKAKQTE